MSQVSNTIPNFDIPVDSPEKSVQTLHLKHGWQKFVWSNDVLQSNGKRRPIVKVALRAPYGDVLRSNSATINYLIKHPDVKFDPFEISCDTSSKLPMAKVRFINTLLCLGLFSPADVIEESATESEPLVDNLAESKELN